MKLSITPVALAVTMALGAAAAQAQTVPTYGTTAPGLTGLYLAVWDNSTDYADVVNLSSTFANTALFNAAGNATTNTGLTTPTSAYSLVANPTGAGGMVEQLNLGTISNFSSLFPTTSSNTQYVVAAATNQLSGALVSSTYGTTLTPGTGASTLATAVVGEISDWEGASNTSPLGDKTGAATFNPTAQNNALQDGFMGFGAGIDWGTDVGSAAQFYDYVGSAHLTPNQEAYSYDGQNGFWFLSSSGDLSWNLLESSASTVPLPPAVWLFASGLIGLGLIGRRRERNLGAAA